MTLGERPGLDQAPFFIVSEDAGGREVVYAAVLHLVRERLGQGATAVEVARAIDPDDIGGI